MTPNQRFKVTETEVRTNRKWEKFSKEKQDGVIRVAVKYSDLKNDMALFKPDTLHRKEVRELKDVLKIASPIASGYPENKYVCKVWGCLVDGHIIISRGYEYLTACKELEKEGVDAKIAIYLELDKTFTEAYKNFMDNYYMW